jgi:chromosome segregation ATPase
LEQLKDELNSNKKHLDILSKTLSQKQKSLSSLVANIQLGQDGIMALESEMKSDFNSTITSQERNEIRNLTDSLSVLKVEQSKASESRSMLESKMNTLSISIRSKQQRLAQLQSEASNLSQADNMLSQQSLQAKFDSLNDKIAELDKELGAASDVLLQKTEQLEDLKRSFETLNVLVR